MKKNIKILVIILIIGIFILLPFKVYAGNVTPISNEYPVIEQENITQNTTQNTNPYVENQNNEVTTLTTDKELAEDKALPDAGFNKNMIYVITALVIFAIFAYIKVVKYNVE